MQIKPDWQDWLHSYRKRELDIIFSKCPPKIFKEGLELGAGDGFQSDFVSEYVEKLIVTDINPERLKKQNTESREYRICDAEKVSNVFKNQTFDFIFSSNLLEHLPNPLEALKNMHKILKDGGVVIHIIPSPFWKICHLFFYIPNILVQAIEIIFKKNRIAIFSKKMRNFRGLNEGSKSSNEYDNNVKAIKAPRRTFFQMLMPAPHGVSSNNIKEFYALTRKRWKEEFQKANFEVMTIKKGPVASGYGFGLNFLRTILEKIGFASEYIYILNKSGEKVYFKQYF